MRAGVVHAGPVQIVPGARGEGDIEDRRFAGVEDDGKVKLTVLGRADRAACKIIIRILLIVDLIGCACCIQRNLL